MYELVCDEGCEAQYEYKAQGRRSDTVIVMGGGGWQEGEQLIVITSLQLIQGCGSVEQLCGRAANRPKPQHEISLPVPIFSLY